MQRQCMHTKLRQKIRIFTNGQVVSVVLVDKVDFESIFIDFINTADFPSVSIFNV